ncbi:hypothetical protein [Alteromonas mediterranea]|uniref:hypothetical protein n=1 Tax=Alteromonas mediterranea TaxID=314275 RepID=UPI0032B2CD5F|tara:strand:- start:7455 stop:10391 length:2937 start_codon:yes stop_codon:yes gene_type:complete
MGSVKMVKAALEAGKEARTYIRENIDPRFFKPRGGSTPRKADEVLTPQVTDLGTQDAPRVALQDLEGRPFVTTMSDRTRAGAVLEGIGDVELAQPVNLTGGQGYMLENGEELWASAKSVTPKMVAAGKQAKKDAGGVDPVMMNWRMSPSGGDFAHKTGQTMLVYNSANMPKTSKRAMDADIKKLIPDWLGVDDPRSVAQYGQQKDRVRKAVIDLMDKKYRDQGGLSLPQARISVTDVPQLNAQDLGFQNVGIMDVERGVIPDGGNPTYPSAIAGEGLGRLDTNATVIDLIPELMDGRASVHDARRALEMKPYTGVIDDKMLKRLQAAGVKVNSFLPYMMTAGAAGGMLASPEADAGLFSAAVKAADSLSRSKPANAQAFYNDLTKGGAKPNELDAIGFKDHFGDRTDITTGEVQDFINSNQIKIEEILLGDAPQLSADEILDWAKDNFHKGHELYHEARTAGERSGALTYIEDVYRQENVGNTKFGEFTLGSGYSGSNYRELLMTLPNDKAAASQEMSRKYDELVGERYDIANSLDAIDRDQLTDNPMLVGDELKARRDELWDQQSELDDEIMSVFDQLDSFGDETREFVNPDHFDHPNILTHLRMVDRKDTDGSNVLLIEELQSDWHKFGKEDGYFDPKAMDNLEIEIDQNAKAVEKAQQDRREFVEANGFDPSAEEPDWDLYKKLMETNVGKSLKAALDDAGSKQANLLSIQDELITKQPHQVPDAPFKNADKTTWYDLALKRAIIEAAEGGYDKLALTTGKQQSDRYMGTEGLIPLYDKTFRNRLGKLGNQPVGQTKFDRMQANTKNLTPEEAQEYKAVSQTWPQTAESKQRLAELVDKTMTDNVHSIDVTPELVDRVKKGLPLFSQAGLTMGGGALLSDQAQSATNAPQEDGFLKDTGDVLNEAMSSVNRGVVDGLNFFTVDQINAVLQLMDSEKRVPTLYDVPYVKEGTRGNFMDKGLPRDVVRTGFEMFSPF